MKQKVIKIAKWTLGIFVGGFLFISLLVFIFKDKIIETSIAEINKNLEVPMEVGDVAFAFWSTFPNISVDLLDVEIKSRNTSVSLLKSKKFKREVLGNIPLGRFAELSDVASAAVFLASDAASMINGTSLLVDGGWTAK